ncbi:MAG: hypothetical protein LKG27_03140 [Clostridiaceae bacterium]|nr:hypothetical protein [Clostridiaceae bacterium]
MNKYGKVLLALVLAVNITLLPVSAEVFDYSKYDFSDEAQRQFDNQNTYNPTSKNDDYSVEKPKNKNSSQTKTQPPVYVDEDNYVNPSDENNSDNEDTNNYQNNDNSDNYQDNNSQNDNSNYQEYNNNDNNNVDETNTSTTSSPTNKTLQGSVVYVPAGTTFDVVFESGISSGSLDKSDRLTVTLPQDFVYNGRVVAPAGSMVSGSVQDSKSAGYAYGSGSMAIQFDEIEPTNGSPFKISTETIVVTAKSTRAKNMTRDVLIGTGMGILGGMLGFLLTGGAGGEDFIRAIAIGGGIGTVAGGAHGAMTRGDDVKIPDGTKIQLKLTQPINISPYN